MGYLLALLAGGDRVLRLGYSGIGDYARERLGVSAHHARDLAALARASWKRPAIREAVHDGRLGVEKAAVLVRVGAGHDEALVELARGQTVESLEALLGASGDGAEAY